MLEPVGTAPGLVVPAAEGRSGPPVVVLPGPPSELQPMWPDALAAPVVQEALRGAVELRQETMRLWGVPESQLAATMRGLDLSDLEITTCLRDGELEVVTRFGPNAQPGYDAFAAALAEEHGSTLYSPDGRTVDDLVADTLLERGWTIATAESCTAGLLAGRLTERAGSSAYVLGGLVVYSNQAKHDLAGVASELIDRVGAVSAEVAEALAAGARERLGADLGVGITGVAGPGGGTDEKPVGTVHFCVSTASASVARRVQVPGDRAAVRQRSTTIALHLVRELSASSREPPATARSGTRRGRRPAGCRTATRACRSVQCPSRGPRRPGAAGWSSARSGRRCRCRSTRAWRPSTPCQARAEGLEASRVGEEVLRPATLADTHVDASAGRCSTSTSGSAELSSADPGPRSDGRTMARWIGPSVAGRRSPTPTVERASGSSKTVGWRHHQAATATPTSISATAPTRAVRRHDHRPRSPAPASGADRPPGWLERLGLRHADHPLTRIHWTEFHP